MKKAKLKTDNNKNTKELEAKFSIGAKVVTVIIMLALLVGAYFLTEKLIDKNVVEDDDSAVINVREENDINYSDVEDIKDDNYYLLFDKEDDEFNSTYDVYINSLKYSGYNKNIYYIDLSKKENKDILGNKESLKDLKKIKVKDTTLVYVEDGKIKETYVGSSDISNHLLSFFTVETEKSDSNSNKKSDSNKNSDSNSNKKSDSNKNSESNSEK